jgi:hAT family C-terminal dimerisation region
MATQSSTATLENCLPAMDYLLGLFEEAKVRYRDDPFMASRVNSAWSKLDKYYSKTNDSAAYIAALVLDPCMKWEYITSTWQPEWIPDAKALVVQLWKKYRPTSEPSSDPSDPSDPTDIRPLNAFTTWKQQKSGRRADYIDEYFRYIREPPIPHDHIKGGACSWWLEERQQRLYPNLYKMALDILTIPAMSAAPERLFSSANITISDRRNSLHSDTTEAIECLKSWRKIQTIRLESEQEVRLRLDQVTS